MFTYLEISWISKEINTAEHEYMNISPPPTHLSIFHGPGMNKLLIKHDGAIILHRTKTTRTTFLNIVTWLKLKNLCKQIHTTPVNTITQSCLRDLHITFRTVPVSHLFTRPSTFGPVRPRTWHLWTLLNVIDKTFLKTKDIAGQQNLQIGPCHSFMQ